MSIFRHPDTTVQIRSFGVTFRRGQPVPPTLHGTPEWHQLIYATRGVVTVYTDDGAWVVPPHRGVWIPAGCRYRIEMSGEVALRMLYLLARKAVGHGFVPWSISRPCCAS